MTDTVNDVWTPTEADREITSHKELVVDGKYRVRALFNGSPRFISEEAFTYNYPYEPELPAVDVFTVESEPFLGRGWDTDERAYCVVISYPSWGERVAVALSSLGVEAPGSIEPCPGYDNDDDHECDDSCSPRRFCTWRVG